MKLLNNRYEIIELIGEGEFGAIYKVKDLYHKNPEIKALKLYNFDKNRDLAVNNFKSEFIYLKFFPLPFVPEVFDFDRIKNIDNQEIKTNYYFYTLEYIEGDTLENLLKNNILNDNQKEEIINKINIILSLIHKIDLYHGDFSLNNILLKKYSNKFIPYFIDLEQRSTKLSDLEKYREIFNKELINHEFDERIYYDYKFNNLKNLFLSNNIKSLIIQLFEKIKLKNSIKIINFQKTGYDLFSLIKIYINAIVQIFEYIFVEIDLTDTYENNLRFLTIQLKKQDINEELILKIENYLNNNLQKGFQNYYIFYISLLEELSLYKPTIVFLNNYDIADNEKINFINNIFRNIYSNNISFLLNSHKFVKFNDEKFLFFYPDKNFNFELLKNEGLEKLNKILFFRQELPKNFEIKDILNILNNLDGNNLINYKEIINKVINKNLEDFYIKDSNEIEKFYNLLIFLFFINSPSSFQKIKDFSQNILKIEEVKFENFINILMNKEFLFLIENNQVLINKNSINKYIEKSLLENHNYENSKIKIVQEIINYFYPDKTNLNLSDYIYLSYLYLIIEKYRESLQNLYYNVFLNFNFFLNRYNENLNLFLNFFNIKIRNIEKEYDNFIKKFKNIDKKDLFDFLVILLTYISLDLNSEEKENILNKINSQNNIINFSKTIVLGKLYIINLNPEKMNTIFNKLNKDFDKYSFKEKIFYYLYISEYYYHKSEFKNLEKVINEIIDKFEKDNDFEDDNIPYLLTQTYVNYAEIFFNNKDLEGYFYYNNKAKSLAEKYRIYDLLVEIYTNLGIYFYYQKNDTDRLKEFFYKAHIVAEKFNIISLLSRTNNNIAATSDDIQLKKTHYLKALNYASYLEDKKVVLVLLYNLSKYLTPKKMDYLLKKYSNYIFEFKELDIVTNENFLLSIIAAFYTLFRMGYEEELKKYYEKIIQLENSFLKNEKNKNLYLIIKTIYEIRFFYNKISLEDKELKKEYLNFIKDKINFIKEIVKNLFSYNYQDIFYFTLTFLYNEKIKSYFDKILINILDGLKYFYSTKDKNKENALEVIKEIFENINDKNYLIKLENEKIDKIIKLDIPILDYLALVLKGIIYYLKDNESYIRFLSAAIFIYKKQINYYKKEEIINKTTWVYFYELLQKYFNKTDLEKIFISSKINRKKDKKEINILNNKNIFTFIYNNFEKNFINSLSLDKISGLKEICKTIINEFYFDRAIFYSIETKDSIEESKKLKKEFVIYFDENFYSSSEPAYISESEMFEINSIFLKKFNINEDEGISTALTIPIFEPTKIKNLFIDKNSRKTYSSYNFNYFYGYIYFDKKNNIKLNLSFEKFKYIQILISNFYFNKMEEEKYLKDFLTKFYLRDVFYKKISNFIYEERNKNIPITFLYIDIDHFKKVNDTFGHQKGDEILSSVANIIKENVRRDDLTCRFGGEELVIALFNTNKSDGINIAEKIRKKVEDAKLLGDKMKVTISIGISCYPEDGKWIEELINIADTNLYKAKESGRNRVIYN